MKHAIGNYLSSNRKKWSLSQPDLALLLGVSRAAVSRYETGESRISLSTALALEAIFGLSPRDAFAGVYARRLDQVMRAAAKLDERLRHRQGPSALRRRALLSDIIQRAQ